MVTQSAKTTANGYLLFQVELWETQYSLRRVVADMIQLILIYDSEL